MADTTQRFITEFVTKNVADLDRASDKVQKLNDKVNGLATALLGVSFGSFIAGALQAADRISDFSDATNISIASLKALEAAMNSAGGNGKNLEKSINALYAAIDSANSGSLQARDAFAKVGISLGDLKNLSEADILQKTLEGLAQLPAGAERSAVATQLLSRSFRGIDPSKLIEALDPEKYAASEEATKRAADAQQRLEEKYKILQEGAIAALEPILKMMGEHNLTVENATKLVQGLGIAFGVLFGAQVIAGVSTMVRAIISLNTALKGTAVVQAGIQALQGPKGWAILAGAGAAATAAMYGLNKMLEETEIKGQAAQEAVAGVAEAAGVPTTGKKIQQAKPQAGAAGRNQELDARQRAAIESNRRIAVSKLETDKLLALKGATDIQKIELDRDAEIAKAREEIQTKENLSATQKAKEFAAKRKEIEAKAELEISRIKQDQQSQLLQQRQSYSDTIGQLLGYEKTELQKINDQIALQPDKYREIGDQLRANASEQDRNLLIVKKITEEQKRQKQLADEIQNIRVQGALSYNSSLLDIQKIRAVEGAASKQEAISLGLQYDYQKKMASAASQLSTYKEYMNALDYEGEDLSMAQSEAILRHIELRAKLVSEMEKERNMIAELEISEYNRTSTFDYAWQDSFKKYRESAMDTSSQVKNSFNNFTQGMEDAFVRFAQTGKLSFRDMANSILADLARIAVKRAIVGIGSFFGLPGLAEGGPVLPNKPYIIGEKGPELFLPNTAGTVVPNSALGTSGGTPIGQTTVNYNIQAVDAASFRSLVARDPSFIYAVTEQGRRSQPTRSR